MKRSLLLSLLMFICLVASGQKKDISFQQDSIKNLQVSVSSLQDSVQSLQETVMSLRGTIQDLQGTAKSLMDSIKVVEARNQKQDLYKQVDILEKDINRYQNHFSQSVDDYNTKIGLWLVLLTIIIALISIVFPININRQSAKNAEKAKDEATTAKIQVAAAQEALNEAKEKTKEALAEAKEKTKEALAEAKESAKQAFNETKEKAQEALNEAKEQVAAAQQAVAEAKKSAAQAQTDAGTAKTQAEKAKTDADKIEQVETTVNNLVSEIKTTAAEAKSGFMKAKAVQYFIQAIRIQEREPNKAIDLYSQCINEDPEFAEAYNYRGFLKHKIGDNTALDDYTIAIIKKSDYAEALNNRGILYFENKEMFKAKEDFNAAIALDYVEAYLNRGLLNYQRGDVAEARTDFNNTIEKKPNFAEAYYIRGLLDISTYLYDYGIFNIKKAREFKFDVFESYPNRSLLSGKMKELDNSFHGVEYSKDMKKLLGIPEDKKGTFILLNCVTEIESRAFAGCTGLDKIIVDDNNPNFCLRDGALYSKDMKTLISWPGCKDSIKIHDNVTEIGDYAFYGCKKLTSIEIPDDVNKIGDSAFQGCTSLNTINIPNGVNNIGSWAFQDCTSLNTIKIPDGVNKIGNSAFQGCTSLNTINIPNGVNNIGSWAFRECISLTSIEIPNSVTKIGYRFISGCTSLKEIHFKHKNPVDFAIGFLGSIRSKITLYVPKGSVEAYRKHEFYKRFKKIIEE